MNQTAPEEKNDESDPHLNSFSNARPLLYTTETLDTALAFFITSTEQ